MTLRAVVRNGALCGLLLPRAIATPSTDLEFSIEPTYNLTDLRRRQNVADTSLSWISKWAAVGDSYSAGIGAGTRINWWCSRYDSSYPSAISKDARMSGKPFEYKSCSGHLSSQIQGQVSQLTDEQDAIVISAGGNDVGLKDILNYCIYAWYYWTGVSSCTTQIGQTMAIIQNDLPGNLDRLYAAARGKLSGRGKVYVTAYGRFFDETTTECDSVSWHWVKHNGWATPRQLTQQLRHNMNTLVDMVNQKIREAVARAGSRFVLVEYDQWFGELDGRYCTPGVSEPDPNRADLLFYLDGTDEDQWGGDFVAQAGDGDPHTFPEHTFEAQVIQLMKNGYDHAMEEGLDPDAPEFGGIFVSDSWARVFHPLRIGHAVIANKVLYHMVADGSPESLTASPETCPIRADIPGWLEPGWTDTSLNGNFPKYFILSDGRHQDAVDIVYRMRDKLCQDICDPTQVDGVPSQFVRATQVGDHGCEYAVKIAHSKELYLYATEPEENCYVATEKILLGRGQRESGWINGPNTYEFYQSGVRDLNSQGPGGLSHEPFDASKTSEHLGYMHLSCRRSDWLMGGFFFNLRISNWDDGNWGKSIQAEADKCGLVRAHRWIYEPDQSEYLYPSDGTKPENFGYFELQYGVAYRCGEKAIETALGLSRVDCPQSEDFYEMDMLTT